MFSIDVCSKPDFSFFLHRKNTDYTHDRFLTNIWTSPAAMTTRGKGAMYKYAHVHLNKVSLPKLGQMHRYEFKLINGQELNNSTTVRSMVAEVIWRLQWPNQWNFNKFNSMKIYLTSFSCLSLDYILQLVGNYYFIGKYFQLEYHHHHQL